MERSPFNAKQDYSLRWQRVHSIDGAKATEQPTLPHREFLALRAINAIGLIGSSQLSHLFLNGQKRVRARMEKQSFILRHHLLVNGKQIDVYTLGKSGMDYLGAKARVTNNAWLTWPLASVLQRLEYWRLYTVLKTNYKGLQMGASQSPYVGKISIRGQRMEILPLKNRDTVTDHCDILTIKKPSLIVCEDTIEVYDLAPKLENAPVRYVFEEELDRRKATPLTFYRYQQGQWLSDLNNNPTTHAETHYA